MITTFGESMSSNGLGLMHDVLYDCFSIKYPNSEIIKMVDQLPTNILRIAMAWGFSDTVFRDDAHEYWSTCNMEVYLDDARETPEGWIRVYWPDEAIRLLETGRVKSISLDHDLGDDQRGTGYDVVLWIEERVRTSAYKPPNMVVHSANVSARLKMEAGIRSITKYIESHE